MDVAHELVFADLALLGGGDHGGNGRRVFTYLDFGQIAEALGDAAVSKG
jgi:hypothetical protein